MLQVLLALFLQHCEVHSPKHTHTVTMWKSIHHQQEIICVETLELQETKGHLVTASQEPREAGP